MAIQRIIAKSLGPIRHACSQFEKFLNDGNEWLVVFGFGQRKLLSKNKGYLLFPSFKKDLLHTIVQVLIEENILCDNNNRDHSYSK